MNFRGRKYSSQIPKLDLIPLLNVMMVVLAFFVLISLSLRTPPDSVEVELPQGEAGGEIAGEVGENSAIAYFNTKGEFLFQGQILNETEVQEQILLYLQENSQNNVFLVADPDVPYEQVIQALSQMQAIDGDRVSLGLFSN